MPNYTNSVWSEATPAPPYAPLAGNVAVDVAIVGGGITGITAALLLARAGRRVAVIEARRIGKGETGKTTAHLTEVLDVPYHTLLSRFGADGARLAAMGQRDAIERIAGFADECAIACDFTRVPGFMFAETNAERAALEREAVAAHRLGVGAMLLDRAPLPFPSQAPCASRTRRRFIRAIICRGWSARSSRCTARSSKTRRSSRSTRANHAV